MDLLRNDDLHWHPHLRDRHVSDREPGILQRPTDEDRPAVEKVRKVLVRSLVRVDGESLLPSLVIATTRFVRPRAAPACTQPTPEESQAHRTVQV